MKSLLQAFYFSCLKLMVAAFKYFTILLLISAMLNLPLLLWLQAGEFLMVIADDITVPGGS
jgi:hypothetical protein